jgi:hypothetical protein
MAREEGCPDGLGSAIASGALPPASLNCSARRVSAVAGRLRADRGGSIVLMAALSFFLLVAATAMALDLTQLYIAKSNVQRIADQSAVAAALAYFQSTNQTTANNAALSLATANGIADTSTNVTTTFVVSSPTGDGNNAELITITAALPLIPFTKGSFNIPSMSVSASAWGEIETKIPCIETVNNDGIFTTGGPTLTATGCNIESSSIIDWALDGSAGTVTASKITAVGAITNAGHTVINGPETANTTAPTDLFKGVLDSGALFGTITTVAALTAASVPSIGSAPTGGATSTCDAANSSSATARAYAYGTVYGQITMPNATCYIKFSGGSGSTGYISAASNCNGSNAAAICLSGGNNYTLNIVLGPGTYNIAGLYASAGAIAIIATGNPTINIWNGITATANGAISIDGAATVNVLGGISDSSNGQMAFCVSSCTTQGVTLTVDGGISISTGSAKFGDANVTVTSGDGTARTGAGLDIGGGVTVTFGDGTFNIANGINVSGGSNLTFGTSSGGCPSLTIPSTATTGTSAGYAIYTSGGTNLTFTYACASNQINGSVAVQGNFVMNSSGTVASTWTIAGALGIGGPSCNNGGSTWSGTLVQVIVRDSICVGAGYSYVSLSPQTPITTQTLSTLPTVTLAGKSSAASGSSISAGGNISMTGGFYLPYQPLYMTGAGTLNSNGGCLVVDVKALSLQNGSSILTNCTNVTLSTAEARLVQ